MFLRLRGAPGYKSLPCPGNGRQTESAISGDLTAVGEPIRARGSSRQPYPVYAIILTGACAMGHAYPVGLSRR